MSYRALIVAIPEPGGFENENYPSLLDHAHHAGDVARLLGHHYGYECNDPSQTHQWDAQKLHAEVGSLLRNGDSEDVRVVLLFGHGESEFGSLLPVGADGRTDSECDVLSWLKVVQPREGRPADRPLTLFIIDTCGAGEAADPSWGGDVPAEGLRGWVLAASAKNRTAYNGRLSNAVAEALKQIAEGNFGLSDGEEWVRWSLFRDRVREIVERVQGQEFPQRVTATRTDREVHLPFLRNPAYVPPGPVEIARRAAPLGLGDFLDAEHFIERASGRFKDRASEEVGAFAGRRSQLEHLTGWIEDPSDNDFLRIVTGSPGAGKSALVSILVCAAHPALRDTTALIWARAVTVPDRISAFAAVHARGLSVSDVATSIAKQLGLQPEPIAREASESNWGVSDLVDALGQCRDLPLIVIDAVDESADTAQLLLFIDALRGESKAGGGPLCRLLVATRAGTGWPEIENWLNDFDTRQVLDLDNVPPDEMRSDLAVYFRSSLPASARIFSRRFADALVEARSGRPPWGVYLVAALLARAVRRSAASGLEATSSELVERVLLDIPHTVEGVLALDLSLGSGGELQRAVLTCVAWAKGRGMPLHTILILVRQVFYVDYVNPVNISDVSQALRDMSFYLRTNVDRNGETLFSLFHQSLVDHLRDGSERTAKGIVFAFLADRPVVNGHRQWSSAGSYARRHVLDHAIDAGCVDGLLDDTELLVFAESGAVHAAFKASMSNNPATEAVYRGVPISDVVDEDGEGRRWALALEAARRHRTELARTFIEGSGIENQPVPRWVRTRLPVRSLRFVFSVHRGEIRAVAVGELEGRPVVASGGMDRRVLVWGLSDGALLRSLEGHSMGVSALAWSNIAGRSVVASGSYDGRVLVWWADDGGVACEFSGHGGPVTSLCWGELNGQSLIASGSRDGRILVWDSTTGEVLKEFAEHSSAINAVAWGEVKGTQVVASAGADGLVFVRAVEDGTVLFSKRAGRATAIAFGELSGRPVLAAALDQWSHSRRLKTLQTWDLFSGSAVGGLIARTGSGKSLAWAQLDGHPVVLLGSSDRNVYAWDPQNHSLSSPQRGHVGSVRSVAYGQLDGRALAVSGSVDKTVRVWELPPLLNADETRANDAEVVSLAGGIVGGSAAIAVGTGSGTIVVREGGSGHQLFKLEGHTGRVYSLVWGSLDSEPVLVSAASDASVRLWDVRRGELIRVLSGHSQPVRAVAWGTVDGRGTVASTGFDSTIRTWDAGSGEAGRVIATGRGRIRTAAWGNLEGRTALLVAGQSGGATIWDPSTGELMRVLGEDRISIRSAVWTDLAGRAAVVAACASGGMQIWDPVSGNRLRMYGEARSKREKSRNGKTVSIAVTTVGGTTIAAAGRTDGLVDVWNISDGTKLQSRAFNSGAIVALDWRIDGGTLTLAVATALEVILIDWPLRRADPT